MNLRDAFKQIQANILAGNAVILKGAPGLGKSDLMSKVAKWYRSIHPDWRIGMSTTFMATQSPMDWIGTPWKGERKWVTADGDEVTYTVTDPAIPRWFLATCLDTGEVLPASLFHSVILVIEEWGQGSAEAKRAGAEVLRAGGTPPWYLPAGSPRIAITNVDAGDGVTKEFDFIIGRRGELPITGDVNVWLEDFADRPYEWQGKAWSVLPVTKAWAARHPHILFEPKPEVQGPWCTARTLTAADRCVQTGTDLNGGEIPLNNAAFVENIAGHIGMPAATSYIGDLQFVAQLPSYEDIVRDPEGTEVPAKADLQMLMAYTLAGRVQPNDKHIAAVVTYMTKEPAQGARMPADMAATFITSLIHRDYKNFLNRPAIQEWIAKNARLNAAVMQITG
jgi:hypothetical protein